jgi:glyoxylase-like metal-dependent hydrolase (beta-lactamase superfamily II)
MRLIDVLHLDRERVIGCWQVGDVLVDPGPGSCLPTLLDALGDERPRALLLTHIHLDHAGASGSLVQRWPDLEVYVHERGAPHLTDPSRLLRSARRLYGDYMDQLWGEMLPVPERNVRVLEGGERLIDGAFEVAYTPGHASHHVCYLHEGTAFVGDVGGVRIAAGARPTAPGTLTTGPGTRLTGAGTRATAPHTRATPVGAPAIPPTPPPDIDIEAWHRSIEQIRRWAPRRLAVTHFGAYEDVDVQLREMSVRLDDWAERARARDGDAFIAGVNAEIDAGVKAQIAGVEADIDAAAIRSAYYQAAPAEQIYMGLERYWRKRAEAIGAEATPPVS